MHLITLRCNLSISEVQKYKKFPGLSRGGNVLKGAMRCTRDRENPPARRLSFTATVPIRAWSSTPLEDFSAAGISLSIGTLSTSEPGRIMALYIPVKIVVIDCAQGCLFSPGMSLGLQARRACGSVGNPGCLRSVRLLQSTVASRRCGTVAPAAHERQQEDCVCWCG